MPSFAYVKGAPPRGGKRSRGEEVAEPPSGGSGAEAPSGTGAAASAAGADAGFPVYPSGAAAPVTPPLPPGATFPAVVAAVLASRVATLDALLSTVPHGAVFSAAVHDTAAKVNAACAAMTTAPPAASLRNPKNVTLEAEKAELTKELQALTSEVEQWQSEAARLEADGGVGGPVKDDGLDETLLARLVGGASADAADAALGSAIHAMEDLAAGMRAAATVMEATRVGAQEAARALRSEGEAGAGAGGDARAMLQSLATQGGIVSPRKLLGSFGGGRRGAAAAAGAGGAAAGAAAAPAADTAPPPSRRRTPGRGAAGS